MKYPEKYHLIGKILDESNWDYAHRDSFHVQTSYIQLTFHSIAMKEYQHFLLCGAEVLSGQIPMIEDFLSGKLALESKFNISCDFHLTLYQTPSGLKIAGRVGDKTTIVNVPDDPHEWNMPTYPEEEEMELTPARVGASFQLWLMSRGGQNKPMLTTSI